MPRHYRLSWFQKVGHGYWFHSYKDAQGKWKKKYFKRGSSKHGDTDAYRNSVIEFDAWAQENKKAHKEAPTPKTKVITSRSGWRPKNTIEGLFDRWVSDLLKGVIIATDAVGKIGIHKVAFKRFIKPRSEGGFLRGHHHPEYKGLHSISGLTDKTIIGYAKWLVEEVRRNNLKHSTARTYLNSMKHFAQYCYENRFIDDYRFPERATVGSAKTIRTIITYELDELKMLYNRFNPRMKLIMLLSLNTGYTAADVADLRLGHIQFNSSGTPERIKKHRTKTQIPQDHILWPKTAELLLSWINKKGIEFNDQLVFLTTHGTPLCRNVIKMKIQPDGSRKQQTYHLDVICESFRNQTLKLKQAGTLRKEVSFKHFRKTAGTRIYEECLEAGAADPLLIEQCFYSHTPTSISRLYYTKVDRSILDPYLLAVGRHFSYIWLEGNSK